MLRCEIDVVLVSLVVDSCTEVNSIEVPVIPPVPSHLTRLHPAPVHVGSRSGKTVNEVVVSHLNIILRHGYNSPRELYSTIVLGNVRFTALHLHLKVVVTALLHLFRIRSKTCLKNCIRI